MTGWERMGGEGQGREESDEKMQNKLLGRRAIILAQEQGVKRVRVGMRRW
jgi:hypothetical protein